MNVNMVKHTKIYKKGLTFFTTIIMGISGYGLAKAEDYFNKGDSVKTIKSVNMRLGTSTDTFKLGEVPNNYVVDRIISKNGFDLIRYNNQIAFVSSEFTDSNVEDYNNEYYYVEEDNDIIRTTTSVNYRLGPSTTEKIIYTLDSKEELIVLGKAINYSNPEDIWYLAKHKDKIGFINAKYTKSLKNTIKSMDSNITNINIEKIGYIKSNSEIYDNQNNVIDKAEEYQIVKIIEELDNKYLVEYNNTIGFIPKNNVNAYKGTFVVVDLSDQKVYLYCNTDMVFESVCTTGCDKTPTRVGAFSVYEKTNTRYFSKNAQAKYMWRNFDHGNGLHDAPWEEAQYFGSEKYRKRNGSAGCVRLPDEAAIFLKDYIKMGTKVLVKK